MFANKDGLRIFEGRFNEIVSHWESRAIGEPDDWVPTSTAEQIELLTTEGERIILTPEDGNIRMTLATDERERQ